MGSAVEVSISEDEGLVGFHWFILKAFQGPGSNFDHFVHYPVVAYVIAKKKKKKKRRKKQTVAGDKALYLQPQRLEILSHAFSHSLCICLEIRLLIIFILPGYFQYFIK